MLGAMVADRTRRSSAGRARARRWIIVGITVAVVGSGFAGAWAATRPPAPAYRTATAGPGAVTANLNETGTIVPVSEASVTCPVSGQVASIAVAQGQQVSAGQILASLD